MKTVCNQKNEKRPEFDTPLKKQRIGSKLGTYLVEAVVMLPITILVVLLCILIVILFYNIASQQSDLHRALRAEAGMVTGKTQALDSEEWSDDIKESRSGLFKIVSADRDIVFRRHYFLNGKSLSVSGSWHACDGVKYIRYRRLLE